MERWGIVYNAQSSIFNTSVCFPKLDSGNLAFLRQYGVNKCEGFRSSFKITVSISSSIVSLIVVSVVECNRNVIIAIILRVGRWQGALNKSCLYRI